MSYFYKIKSRVLNGFIKSKQLKVWLEFELFDLAIVSYSLDLSLLEYDKTLL